MIAGIFGLIGYIVWDRKTALRPVEQRLIALESEFHRDVAIETGEVIDGRLPRRAGKLVREWCLEHREELAENWQRAVALQPLQRIPGADND